MWALVEVVGQHHRSVLGWGCSVLLGFMGTIPDYLAVGGTTDTVMWFCVQPGKHPGLKDTHFGNIPNGCGLCCVSNDKRHHGTCWAANGPPMAVTFFGKSVVPSFLGHLGSKDPRETPLSIFELQCLSLDCKLCHCHLQRGNRQRGGVPGSRTPGPQVDGPPPPTQQARGHCLSTLWMSGVACNFDPSPRPLQVLSL